MRASPSVMLIAQGLQAICGTASAAVIERP